MVTALADAATTKRYLDALDLEFISTKMSSELYELSRWPMSLAQTAVQLYKDFLWLHYLHPTETIVPTRDIDECWHLHILSTKKYAKDCDALFGSFFHHNPANPTDGDELEALIPIFKHTQDLYQRAFDKKLVVLNRLS